MDSSSIKFLIVFTIALLLGSCGTVKHPYYSDQVLNWATDNQPSPNKHIHSLYLIGDAGGLDDTIQNKNFVLDAAERLLEKDTVNTSLVFLGDNVYPQGLPENNHPDRNMAERILDAQLQLTQAHEGNSYFIPGEHDWNKHKQGGRRAIIRQEDYINSFDPGNKNIKFYPKNACGDPEVVKINKDLVYVFLDSQWWLQDWSKEKEMNRKCDIKSRGDLLKRVEEIFADHKNDEIIVMLHHPLKSNGMYGGNFGFKQHVFPLTEINKNLWIPLPGIGKLYPIYRNVTGSKQDISNVKNKDLMQGLEQIALKWGVHTVFVSGHDNGLQFFKNAKLKYIVSGSGSRNEYVQKGGEATYARSSRGFTKIDFLENNEAWLEMYTVGGFGYEPILDFRTQLRAPRQGTIEEEVKYAPIREKTTILAANEKFAAGPMKKFFLGDQYRDIWATPVKAEVIDLETKLGGLTPIKKGGGMASNSLRMELENGKQYILRSINKDYTKLVPADFSNLKLIDILADQNSASHPYNALIIPTLSKAAGVFYTEPKLVYLKHQRGLGNYNSQFPEELYLLEERPSGDWSDAAQFGNSSEIIGYADLLDILREKKNHFIDQEWVLKSRMFDLLIHDWDRHDDQWRWAKFDEDDKNVYRPIPRDRDQAFYKFKGLIPSYVAAFMVKKFKTMKGDVKDVKSLSFNARYFDRYFLHDLEWSEWETVIKQLQNDLTDADIDLAIKNFPEEITEIEDVPELAKLLKERKSNLMKIGKRLYDYLSKEVEITGTDNKDHFEIQQNKDGSLRVKYFVERDKKGDLLKYDRTFFQEETKEVRLYGLRGKDNFIITGAANNSITLRIIGGEDDDIIENKIQGRKVYAYDDLKGMELSGDLKDKRSNQLEVNEYDRNGFKYNSNFPLFILGYTIDDGLWFGGSVNWTNHSWRADPYKSEQGFSFSIAPGSRDAFQIGYNGHFPNIIGQLDFAPKVNFSFPEYENFFGLGGTTTNPLRERQFHWVRMQNIDIEPLLRLNLSQASHLNFGPTFRYRNIKNTPGRVTDEEASFFTEDALENRQYFGVTANYQLRFVDNKVFPSNGFALSTSVSHLREMSKDEQVTEFSLETQFYVQLLVRPKLVLANNTGYSSSYGDRQFYHYAGIGNRRGLRGFRNERFRGTYALYNNIDLRLRLFKWNNDIIPMDIGILGGYDVGKVYIDDEINPWHSSQTVGVWLDLLGAIVLQPYYSINNDQNTFSFRIGFNF